MAHFKQQPINTADTLTQSLWLNQHITSNRKTLYRKTWENLGITQIKDILNKNNELLFHQEPVNKYNIRTTFLNTLTLHKCILADWLEKLRHSSINALDVHTNLIVINNKILDLTKCKCKEFYWHMINSNIRILSTI